jgi:hypothetical protein
MSKDIKFISERVSYRKTPEELTIVITGKIEKSKETLLLTWLLAWSFCGIYIFIQLFLDYSREEKLYFIVFLSFWFFFEYKILKAFRWRKWGKEYIRKSIDLLTIKKSITDYAKADEYFIENIKNLTFIEKNKTNFLNQLENSFWVIGDDKISFDYQGKTICFGMQLTEKEVNSILKLLTND